MCVPTCRWGWSSRRDFCSGWPCWEVAGPWYLPKIAFKGPGFHLLSQCPDSQRLPKKCCHTVAETELQCMYRKPPTPHHTHTHTHTPPSVFFAMSLVAKWPRWIVTQRLVQKFAAYLPGHNFTSSLSIICSCMVKQVWVERMWSSSAGIICMNKW